MFKQMAVTALVLGAALTVLPAGAFAQDRDDYRYRAPIDDRYAVHEYRERVREQERDRAWRAREWREQQHREHERYERARRDEFRDYRYADEHRDWR